MKSRNPWDNFRFEFALYINEEAKKTENAKKPIICQRMFDVRGYNKNVINSVEIKELIDELTGIHTPTMGMIPNFLKKISKKYSWSGYNPYRVVPIDDDSKNIFENEDIFTFEIKVDKEVIAKSSFSGNWFQKDVRYEVNIREIIPSIISEISEYFSRDEYTTSYGEYDIKKSLAPHKFETK
tara:strand:+ start:3233 stop:3778 length:546 start_codon:yes stop_codon:yes gene_type:complete